MTEDPLQKLFDEWAAHAAHPDEPPWLLNRWEDVEGIEWPPDKIRLMIEHIQGNLDLHAGDRLLEIGCGTGWILAALRKRVRQVAGMDIALKMLRLARPNLPAGSLLGGEMARLPFRRDSLERILCYFVFLNNQDDDYLQRTLKDIVRVLKPGGRALIGQLPDRQFSSEYERDKQRYQEYCRDRFRLGCDHREQRRFPVRLFDRDEITRLLSEQGFMFRLENSFNPFYSPHQAQTVRWRFDIILDK